ncbi:hypothetical protein PMAYCL1PPCAC_15581, partial [Pristionchus mayeri]
EEEEMIGQFEEKNERKFDEADEEQRCPQSSRMLRVAIASVLLCVAAAQFAAPPAWGASWGSGWNDVTNLRGVDEMEVAWRAAREEINDKFYGRSRYFMIPVQILRAHRHGRDIELEVLYGESECRSRGVGARQISERTCRDVRRGADRAIYRVVVEEARRGRGRPDIEAWKVRDVRPGERF